MSFTVFAQNLCPKCRKAIMQSIIERHPKRTDIALHNFACVDCGPIKTQVISHKPGVGASELTA